MIIIRFPIRVFVLFCVFVFVVYEVCVADNRKVATKSKYEISYERLCDENIADTIRLKSGDIAMAISKGEHDNVIVGDIANRKGQILIKKEKYGEGIVVMEEGLDSINSFLGREADNKEALKLKMELHYNIAYCMYHYDMYDDAVNNMIKVLDIAKDNDINHLIAAKTFMGTVMYKRGDVGLARSYLNEAMSLIDPYNPDDENAYGVFNNLATFFINKKETDSALHYYSLALKYCERKNMNNERMTILRNIGTVYYYLGNYDMAEHYVKKAYVLSQAFDYKLPKALIYHDLSTIYLRKGEFQKALQYENKSLELSENLGHGSLRYASYLTRAKIYRKLNRDREAYDDLYKGLTIKDSIFSERKDDKMLAIINNYNKSSNLKDKEILQRDLELARLQNTRRNMMFGFLLMLFCIIIALVIYVSRRLFKQYRVNKNLNTIISKIREKETSYLNSIGENEGKAGQSDRESITESLMNTRNVEIAKEIKHKLDLITDVDASVGEGKEDIIKEINYMLGQLNNRNRWDEFKLYFEKIHPSFYQKLLGEHPDVTQNELRLCAFIFMNMSTKEIASMLNRSVRTIESAKFRLRKKLNIDSTKDTREAIMDIVTKSVIGEEDITSL